MPAYVGKNLRAVGAIDGNLSRIKINVPPGCPSVLLFNYAIEWIMDGRRLLKGIDFINLSNQISQYFYFWFYSLQIFSPFHYKQVFKIFLPKKTNISPKILAILKKTRQKSVIIRIEVQKPRSMPCKIIPPESSTKIFVTRLENLNFNSTIFIGFHHLLIVSKYLAEKQ